MHVYGSPRNIIKNVAAIEDTNHSRLISQQLNARFLYSDLHLLEEDLLSGMCVRVWEMKEKFIFMWIIWLIGLSFSRWTDTSPILLHTEAQRLV